MRYSAWTVFACRVLGGSIWCRVWPPSAAGAWALTEPSNGSDASALQTTATKVRVGN